MKKTLKAFVHYSTESWDPGFQIWKMEMSGAENLIFIKEIEIEVDLPDDFDPRPGQIAALKEKQKQAAAAFHAMNNDLMRQISELEAISYDAVPA